MSPLLFAALSGQSIAQSQSAPLALAVPAPASAEDLAIVFEGRAVYGSDGRRIGRVSKINHSNGELKSVEVVSKSCLGFFKRTYTVPGGMIRNNGGRIELSLPGSQITQLKRVDRL
jgi:sporulation protein YlmC with PRC-barrel domain